VSGYGGVLAAGLALLAAAAVADLLAGVRRRGLTPVPYLLGAAASACLVAAGGGALAGHQARIGIGGALGAGTAGLAADRLSGLFLVISFSAAIPVSLAFASWAAQGRSGRRGLGASYGLTLGAVAVILTAGDAFTAGKPAVNTARSLRPQLPPRRDPPPRSKTAAALIIARHGAHEPGRGLAGPAERGLRPDPRTPRPDGDRWRDACV